MAHQSASPDRRMESDSTRSGPFGSAMLPDTCNTHLSRDGTFVCTHVRLWRCVVSVQERMTYHSTGLHISLQVKESNPDKDSAKQKYCVFKISMWRTSEIEDWWVDGFKVICFWGEWKGMRAWSERHQLYQDISIFLNITRPLHHLVLCHFESSDCFVR